MSWILGFIGASLSPTMRERLVALHPAALGVHEGTGYYLVAGGLEETCHAGEWPGETPGAWAVVGLGIRCQAEHCTFLDGTSWYRLLASQAPDFTGLDGHFAAVHVQPDRADFFCDVLGVRTLYLLEQPDGLTFSTRLDWLAALRGGAAVDFEAFGTHWLTFNQLSTDSLVQGIQRLGPGGRATFVHGRLSVTHQPWTPDFDPTDPGRERFTQTLSALVHPPASGSQRLSLGLSGGLDSRLLLAMRMDATPVRTHVFGPETLPDVQVATAIVQGEALSHRRLHEPIPDADTCMVLVRNHVAQTQAVSSASSVLGLRYYPALRAQGLFMIDGGGGEAARRQFMNRLLRQGRAALHTGDPAAILPYLHVSRADVFNAETNALMQRGALQQIETLWQTLPDPHAIGDENFLDLLGVRARLPNFFGFEQNRLDGLIRNFMPYAQPSLLQTVFQTPLALRRNGRLFRRLIRTRHPALTRYPLVKNNVTYPFRLPTLPAYAWTKIKTRLGHGYTDHTRLSFLETMHPLVLDLVYSQTVQTYPAYDQTKLTRLVTRFYDGRSELAVQVDWWLAFELWRQTLAQRSVQGA